MFENLNCLTTSNLDRSGISDGYDLAFHAVAAVPVPGGMALMPGGPGLSGCWRGVARCPRASTTLVSSSTVRLLDEVARCGLGWRRQQAS